MTKLFIKIKKLFIFFFEFLKFVFLYPIGKLKYRKRTIYLISERGVDARDNGIHMFNYFRKEHPEKEVYYVITKNSPDLYKIEDKSLIVYKKSLKHYLMFFGAKYRISTHLMGCAPDTAFYVHLNKIIKIKKFNVFLQHGVIKDNLVGCYKENAKVDLFICGAKPEYEYILNNFHYDNEVKYTGLARFDGLQEFSTKRQILVMPTWRMYCSRLDKNEFVKSEYFNCWNNLLKNEKLIKSLTEKDIKIIFYPHYEMQKYVDLFTSNTDRVVIADMANYDVQQLLKESMLLITDFSSVFFDFAYMKKPILYYQFDKNKFYKEHYGEGYFSYENHGFGEVVENEEIIELIVNYIENDCKIKEKYLDRISSFFPLHDNKNCERIFKGIEALK